jgi:hypothetical protein
MLLFLIITSLGWLTIVYRLYKTNLAPFKSELRVSAVLLTLAWGGFNLFLGMIQFFDFLESSPKSIFSGLSQQIELLLSLAICFGNLMLNGLLGFRLITLR